GRQPQRGAALRVPPVPLDVRHRLPVRPLRQPAAGPAGGQAARRDRQGCPVTHHLHLATGPNTHRNISIALFLVFVGITLYITMWASRHNKTAADYYAGGRSFSPAQNGLAVAGDYMSAASFLGIAGLIALNGYDGFLYSIGFLVAWLVALLLVAELLRNSGRFTMGDVLSFRMRQRPVRTAAGVSTVVVSIFYLLAQMVGAGSLVALLLGITPEQKFLGMSAETA